MPTIRAAFAGGIVLLLTLAGLTFWYDASELARLGRRPVAVLTVPASTSAPLLTPTPRPTATPQAVISRMARTTPTPVVPSTVAIAAVPAVSISDAGFAPAELRLRAGQVVAWRNVGLQAHDVTAAGPNPSAWGSGSIGPNGSYQQAFAAPGQYDYLCTVHNVMRGRIVVEP